ncbi:kinase [Nocardia brasiliensis]|uniref:kinase n=1 Tax=Nocardia brasiliensis TaxID=37326 RepID=UPI0024556B11|nr:kinase [Nocardia brasiliensis]
MTAGLILYGAPATGKDTVTAALISAYPQFRLFQRLKVGPGRTESYRMTDQATLDALTSAGEILWENQRYGSRYAIDRPGLQGIIDGGFYPVIHAGQPEVTTAIQRAFPHLTWIVVQLECSRAIAHERIVHRATGDTDARMAAWDATPALSTANVTIDTGAFSPRSAARRIAALVQHQATI